MSGDFLPSGSRGWERNLQGQLASMIAAQVVSEPVPVQN
jgi:hypothetical protein